MPTVLEQLAASPVASPVASPADFPIAHAVRAGLTRTPKQLPPWLFYDQAGSLLFDQITELPEYYLTRVERALLAEHAPEMIAAAAEGHNLELIELGAGSADKTRTLLSAAVAHQGAVQYHPVDVSESALETACRRIECELPLVEARPLVADYTSQWTEDGRPRKEGSRKLLLWIGSSIGNFDPAAAVAVLQRIQQTMQPGDSLLLGVDLAPRAQGKTVAHLLAAYNDLAGVTAQFNRNLLVRLNRELAADFAPQTFAHRAVWNPQANRIEMHLESLARQAVRLEALELTAHFEAGESIHTENSYKYSLDQAAALMAEAGFPVVQTWTEEQGWFALLLGQKI